MNEVAGSARFATGQTAVPTLFRSLFEPVVASGALLLSAASLGSGPGSAWAILAMLVFAATFPGSQPQGTTPIGRMSRDIFARWALICGTLLLLGWATQTLYLYDRRALAVWAIVTPFALLATRVAASAVFSNALASEGVQRTAVIVGANRMGRMLADRIARNPQLGTRFCGYFDDRMASRITDVACDDLLGTLSDLPGFVRARGIDTVYCSLPMCSQPRITRLIQQLQDTTASVYFVPDILLGNLMRARVATVDGVPVVALCESPYHGANAVAKRAIDLLFASVILVAILPLLLAIAIAIKRDSPGPVLFKQRRYGADGKEILVYKFRTMTCLEDGDVVRQACADDARVTPIGRFLRRHSLDELPQFLNVLQGTMSVVGPRPHAVAHNEIYRKLIRGYMMRHKVKPGITGLAQIRGLRGETDTIEKMRARVELDLEYLRNWSPLLDLAIVIRTVAVLWRRENAH